jgi:hypothetical protein
VRPSDAAIDLSDARSELRRVTSGYSTVVIGTAAIAAPFQCSPL